MAWKIGSITSKLKADSSTSTSSICDNSNDKGDSNSYSDNKEADDIIKTKSSNVNGFLNPIITSKGYYNTSYNRIVNYYAYHKKKIHPNPSIINELAYGTSSFGISEVGNTKDKFAVAKKKKKKAEEKVECCPSIPLVAKKRNHEIAIIACGCFWNPQQRIQKIVGVSRVIVGYTGGKHPNPTSRDLQDHTQALFIEYNPKKITYLQILSAWRDNDYPWEEPETNDCRSVIFFTNREKQESITLQFLARLARTRPTSTLHVDIEDATTFYQAEEYQQNYLSKQHDAAEEQWRAWKKNKARSGLFPIPE